MDLLALSSDLAGRLAALRRQAGAGTAPAPQTADATPVTRLGVEMDRLAAVRRRSTPRGRDRLTEAELASMLDGELASPGLIAVERRIALPARHGRWALSAHFGGRLAALGFEPADPLFLDTETTGLAGGTGTTAFLVGAARVRRDALVVRQYLLTRFAGEPALLEALRDFCQDAHTLVTFNGKSFDLPLLTTRYRLEGLTDPFAGRPHLDLLHPVRRAFTGRWPDCRLTTAEARLLGFTRQDDLPSAEVPEAWLRWLRRGEAGRLPRVLDHNRWDVLSLAALLPALGEVFETPVGYGADLLAIARHRRRLHGAAASQSLLAAHRGELGHAALYELARLARRNGDATTAVAIWQELAAHDDLQAIEALAKHAEHVERDLGTALALSERLLTLQPHSSAHRRRSERLLRRRSGKA